MSKRGFTPDKIKYWMVIDSKIPVALELLTFTGQITFSVGSGFKDIEML